MAAAPPPRYLYNIPSIRSTHPNLPNTIRQVDLDQAIEAGAEVNREHLAQARAVATALKGFSACGDQLITNAIAESAELRATAVEAAHCTALYAPGNLDNVLLQVVVQMTQINAHMGQLNLRMNDLDARVDEIAMNSAYTAAATENIRIIASNARIQGGQQYAPLLKTTSGHGLDLANDVGHGLGPDAEQALIAPAQVPHVGTTPPGFNPDIVEYGHQDILRMIIFYRNSFGIVLGDSIGARVDKFRRFLVEL